MIDIVELRKYVNGFRGTFEFQPEHTVECGFANHGDFVDVDDRLVFESEDGDSEPYVIAEPIEQHVAEPLAHMLNALPELLDEVERLREVADASQRALDLWHQHGDIDFGDVQSALFAARKEQP